MGFLVKNYRNLRLIRFIDFIVVKFTMYFINLNFDFLWKYVNFNLKLIKCLFFHLILQNPEPFLEANWPEFKVKFKENFHLQIFFAQN